MALVGVLAGLIYSLSLIRLAPPQQRVPVTIASVEWDPYIGPNQPDDGPVGQIIKSVFAMIGYDASIVYATLPNADEDMQNGRALAIAPVANSESRAGYAVYSEPLLEFTYRLFGETAIVSEIEAKGDISESHIGIIDGYRYWDELDNSGAMFTSYPNPRAAFAALARGDVDLVAEDYTAGNEILNSGSLLVDSADYGVVESRLPFAQREKGLHLAVLDTPESTEIRDLFDGALRDFKQTSDYSRLLAEAEDSASAVRIESRTDQTIAAYDTESGEITGYVPNGTSAVLLKWPGPEDFEQRATVKVTSGPIKGRIVAIDAGLVSADDK